MILNLHSAFRVFDRLEYGSNLSLFPKFVVQMVFMEPLIILYVHG